MTVRFRNLPNRILMEKDAAAFFDTAAFPIQVAPAPIVITGQAFAFPDVVKGVAYNFARGNIGSTFNRGCQSVVTMGPQEWGPPNNSAPPTPGADYGLAADYFVLDDIVLGTVPNTCDALYVQFNLTRTNAPSNVNGKAVPVLPDQGAWVNAPGGSLPLEFIFPMARQVDVILAVDEDGLPLLNGDGTRNVVLRRRQSVNYQTYGFYRNDNDIHEVGWTTHGTGVGKQGCPVALIQTQGPSPVPGGAGGGADMMYDGDNHCSLSDPTDYASEYLADIKIWPIFTNEEPDNTAATSPFAFYVGAYTARNTSGQTSYTVTVPIGGAHSTRRLYIFAASGFALSSRPITSVTVRQNGSLIDLPTTPIMTYTGSNGSAQYGSCGFYYVDLPTGEMPAEVKVNHASNVNGVYVAAWVAYNTSLGPTFASSYVSTNGEGNVNVPTAAGGTIMCGGAFFYDGTAFPTAGGLLPGFTNVDEPDDYIAQSNPPIIGWAATHAATAATQGMKGFRDIDDGGSGNNVSAVRWMCVTAA